MKVERTIFFLGECQTQKHLDDGNETSASHLIFLLVLII